MKRIDKFQTSFKNPPCEAFPYVYHWWLKGYVDILISIEEMEGFKKHEISAGFNFLDNDSGTFGSIHYQEDGIDFYFVVSKTQRIVIRGSTFRQNGELSENRDALP